MNANIAISMTQRGSPYENALAERVNGIIKNEFFPKEVYQNHKEAKKTISRIILIYNEKRPHSSIDFLTPEKAHNHKRTIKSAGNNILSKKKRKNKH